MDVVTLARLFDIGLPTRPARTQTRAGARSGRTPAARLSDQAAS